MLNFRGIVVCLYFSIVRPVYKWFLRLITGRCELLRIVYSSQRQPHRTASIEYSLEHSKSPLLRSILTDATRNLDDLVWDIARLKLVTSDQHPLFSSQLRCGVGQITGYRRLLSEVERLRKTTYSSSLSGHESLLMQLWNALKPDSPLASRISHQWTDIGFQGDDPATDFRGMGLLGLENLVFLATRYTDVAHSLLSRSAHPQFGYSFAIVGINITSLAYELLKDGQMKSHFYCLTAEEETEEGRQRPQMSDFHLVYVHLLYEFDKFWVDARPANIMEFNVIREQFRQTVIDQLQSGPVPFRFRFQFASLFT